MQWLGHTVTFGQSNYRRSSATLALAVVQPCSANLGCRVSFGEVPRNRHSLKKRTETKKTNWDTAEGSDSMDSLTHTWISIHTHIHVGKHIHMLAHTNMHARTHMHTHTIQWSNFIILWKVTKTRNRGRGGGGPAARLTYAKVKH